MPRTKVVALTPLQKREIWDRVAQSLSEANKALCRARDTFNYYQSGYTALNAAIETHEAAWRIAAGYMPLRKQDLGCGTASRGPVMLAPITSADY